MRKAPTTKCDGKQTIIPTCPSGSGQGSTVFEVELSSHLLIIDCVALRNSKTPIHTCGTQRWLRWFSPRPSHLQLL